MTWVCFSKKGIRSQVQREVGKGSVVQGETVVLCACVRAYVFIQHQGQHPMQVGKPMMGPQQFNPLTVGGPLRREHGNAEQAEKVTWEAPVLSSGAGKAIPFTLELLCLSFHSVPALSFLTEETDQENLPMFTEPVPKRP